MRLAYIALSFLFITQCAYAQKAPKVTKSQSAHLTPEQRLVHETNRKSKGGKKKLSMKKRVKIDKRQDKRARKIKRMGFLPYKTIYSIHSV